MKVVKATIKGRWNDATLKLTIKGNDKSELERILDKILVTIANRGH